MRARNTNTIFYVPDPAPTDPSQIPMYLQNEYVKIQRAIEQLATGHIDISYVAPTKPRDGDLRYADGTSWNPGSGKGLYIYKTNAWVLLG